MELDPGREAAFFDMVLNFIPAELYLPQPDAANAQKQAWKGKYAKVRRGPNQARGAARWPAVRLTCAPRRRRM